MRIAHRDNLIFQFIGCSRNLAVPVNRILRHPDFYQVIIVRSISEPSAHLKESIIHLSISIEIGNAQSLQRQSSGKAVSTNCDYTKTVFSMIRVIQTAGSGLHINRTNLNRRNGSVKVCTENDFPIYTSHYVQIILIPHRVKCCNIFNLLSFCWRKRRIIPKVRSYLIKPYLKQIGNLILNICEATDMNHH